MMRYQAAVATKKGIEKYDLVCATMHEANDTLHALLQAEGLLEGARVLMMSALGPADFKREATT